jgi:MOSC domain-containing protein YiiM
MDEPRSGKLVGVYLGQSRGERKSSADSAELVVDFGLRGDSHAGRDLRRQVSLFAAERLQELLSEGFEISAGELAANLITENIAIDSLKPRTRLRVGETELEIVEPRSVCRSITRIDNRLPKRLHGQCGQLARVVKGGSVHPGDDVVIS